ncbi:AbrB/MazE/SpoVT family DNA-binding domain-containing protein [Sulfobacillus harzensis]|uniref:AbrB/MazE/SpoVT family DNA-binding domain-containing protein n=1 Tax=Sulfobacillus harzensis TaxID=2729629 RepID=A0A7Y0Q2K7_9FIRM|nr:AbrB/MazE/SpoVT family DNA-binding domain-containing protein [Sulfobacillus harzensis]NMP22622.1 AbrB/MazE/SpoVT family DNA-binding domain-containing protein [Sulfobacillus harzensis]
MAIVRLQRRGMLTVPRDIRQQLHLEEGQPLMVRVIDARRLLIEIIPTLSPDDLFTQFPITTPVDDDWHEAMADDMEAHHQNQEVAPHD